MAAGEKMQLESAGRSKLLLQLWLLPQRGWRIRLPLSRCLRKAWPLSMCEYRFLRHLKTRRLQPQGFRSQPRRRCGHPAQAVRRQLWQLLQLAETFSLLKIL